MKNITILAFFIIGVSPVFGQTDLIKIGEKEYMGNAQGQKMLNKANIDGVCYRIVSTPDGDYLSVEEIDTGKRMVYLSEHGRLKIVESLSGYVLWGYVKSKNLLVLGEHRPTDSYATTSISLYNLTTKKFVLYRSESFGEIASVKIMNDSVFVQKVSTGKFKLFPIN